MAKPGRKKKPAELKDLQGNAGKRGKSKSVSSTCQSSLNDKKKPKLNPPDFLCNGAKTHFKKLVERISDSGINLSANHIYPIAIMAKDWKEYIETAKFIQEDGLIYETENEEGFVMKRPHPAANLNDKAFKRFKSLAVEFGMTPASASSLIESSENEDDEFTKLLRRRAEG